MNNLTMPTPIRDDETHQQAKAMLRALFGRRSSAIDDYKTVLVTLIANYEREAGHRLSTAGVSAADVVRHLLEDRGMTVTALADELDVPKSTLSEMLRGRRAWSKSAIIKICRYFSLKPEVFLL